MKWLFFSLVLALAGAGVLAFNHYYEQEQQLAEARRDTLLKETEEVNELSKLITSTKNKEGLLALQGRVKLVSDKRLEPVFQLALATAIFEDGERYLSKAIEVNNALATPPPPRTPPVKDHMGQYVEQPQPPPPPLHPLVVKNLDMAFKNYKEAKELCDKIQTQPDNNNFNFSMNYFKGEVYYRHTQLLSTPETAKELFDQTLVSWKHALRYKARDIDTVINIELLIKNQQQMLSGAVQPGANRPQMLPASQAGRGKLKGI
jgi:hypothetical protein